MPFIKLVKNFFTYTEPKDKEQGFEVLESRKERSTPIDSSGQSKNSSWQDSNDKSQANNTPQANNKQQGNVKSNAGNKPENSPQKADNRQQGKNEKNGTVSEDLSVNLTVLREKFDIGKNQDIVVREFKIGRKVKSFMIYIDGMIDKQTLNLAVFKPLMEKDVFDGIKGECPVDYLVESILTLNSVKKEKEYEKIVKQILSGLSAVFVEGCKECIILESRGYEKRSIEAPKTESVIIGPQEAFTENLRTNLTLVRRIVKNEKLVTEMMTIGKTNNCDCAILYIDGIASPRVISEVKKRIQKIDTDFIMETGMVEQFIEDNPFMLFPQVLRTERPDRTASFLVEGQVVVISDCTPFAMAVPVTFFRLFHTSEDMFARWPFGTFLRFIRLFGLFCATLLPGLYVAATLFHPEMLPTEILTSIAQTRESVPFPTIVEVLIMEGAFELIREGGIRVPIVIGQTLGIVGALILGQAAVAAGLVSPVVVIIVSITALGSFVIPNHSLALAIRIERFFFIFAGATMGFYGIALLLFLLAIIVCSMKSFGVPFFTPVAPKTKTVPDIIIRAPIWMQKERPDAFGTPNRKRQGKNVKNWSNEEGQDDSGRGGGQ